MLKPLSHFLMSFLRDSVHASRRVFQWERRVQMELKTGPQLTDWSDCFEGDQLDFSIRFNQSVKDRGRWRESNWKISDDPTPDPSSCVQ